MAMTAYAISMILNDILGLHYPEYARKVRVIDVNKSNILQDLTSILIKANVDYMSLDKASEILEVNPSATQKEIDKAYKRKALKVHPDKKGGSHAGFQELEKAHRSMYFNWKNEIKTLFTRYFDDGTVSDANGHASQIDSSQISLVQKVAGRSYLLLCQ